MKNIYLVFILINLIACKLDKPKELRHELNTKEINEVKKEDKLIDKHVDLPLNQKVRITENLNGKHLDFEITYQLDTMRLSPSLLSLKAKNIQLKMNSENPFSEKLQKNIMQVIKERQLYDWKNFKNKEDVERKKFKLLKADFNYDGYMDIYFVNENGFAQNTGYEVYLFNENKEQFIKSEDLSKHYWSSIGFLDETQEIRLSNHFSSAEGSQATYKVSKEGKLKMRNIEIRNQLNSDKGDRKIYKINGRYKNGQWIQDTVIVN